MKHEHPSFLNEKFEKIIYWHSKSVFRYNDESGETWTISVKKKKNKFEYYQVGGSVSDMIYPI